MATTIAAGSGKKASELIKQAGVVSFSSTPAKSTTQLYGSAKASDPKEQARIAANKEAAEAATQKAKAATIQGVYDSRQAEAEKLYNQRQAEAQNIYDQRTAAANATYDQRNADAQKLYDQRQAATQATYNQRTADAQNLYNQRMAEAQNTYNQRVADSEGRIGSLYDKALETQKIQYENALNKGIAAQEEARAGLGQSYQTAANDLAVQYERNKRNLNMQAAAQGLNTGTGSQQQLALNQGYMKTYGTLRGQEAAENAAIDRAIANLKVDYQANVAQAIADNDYQKAAALLDNYNQQLSWLDNQKQQNQSHMDTLTANALNYLDTTNLNNQNRYDTLSDATRNYLDSMNQQNQNRLDTVRDTNTTRFDSTSDSNRNWYDNQIKTRAETLATYGDFSGYADLYGAQAATAMKEMWIAQNPDMAYRTQQITAEEYKTMTGSYPPGYSSGSSGGGGGYYYGGGSITPKTKTDNTGAIKPNNTTGSGTGSTTLYTYNNGRTVTRATTNPNYSSKSSGSTVKSTSGKLK